MESQSYTVIEKFYDDVTKDTNITYAEDVLKQFIEMFPETADELAKPVQEIDFNKLVNSIDKSKIYSLLSWKNPQQNSKQKAAIQKITPEKGDIFGLGNQFKGTILLRDFKSKWTCHSYQFADDKKQLLQTPFEELMKQKESMDYKDFMKVMQLTLQFDLYSEKKEFQDTSCNNSIKALELLCVLISESAVNASGIQLVSGAQIKNQGFIKDKYEEYFEEDIRKMTGLLNIKQISNRFNDSVEIVNYKEVDGNYILEDFTNNCTNINEFANTIKNKKMDLVIALNSCSLKKEGKNVISMPKLQIVQIILKDYNPTQQKKSGLNLKSK